jgi:hypothetical protein
MEIYQNKISGKYFIWLKETDRGEVLFISPNCSIISLKLSLFSEETEQGDFDSFLSVGKITKNQVETYKQYNADRTNEIVERYREMVADPDAFDMEEKFDFVLEKIFKMPSEQKKEFYEQINSS